MAILKALLPAPAATTTTYYDHSEDPWFKQCFSSSEAERPAVISTNPVPPYLNRRGFVPRKGEDFGDGGAFPEIHIAQYPLGMVRDKLSRPGTKILPVTVDVRGNIAYDAIVKQNENAKKSVFSQHKDLVPKILKNAEEEMDEEALREEIEETTAETKAALEKIVNVRLSVAQPKSAAKQSSDSKLIKYKPSQKSVAFNSGAKERLIRMVEMPVDPLEPAKFKHKRVPRPSGSPPVPVMHSPPRPVTEKDRRGWKVPPCISLWKNPKGYTIPLDKRLASELGALRDAQVNVINSENLASLSEALSIAEYKAREENEKKNEVRREMAAREKERKEQELRELAHKARSERVGAGPPAAVLMPSGTTAMETDMRGDYERPREKGMDYPKETREERREKLQREKIREERRRERERERRLEDKDAAMGKKSKITRDRDRDISEREALGMASVGAGKGAEVIYDQRLFNRAKGMDSGFAATDDHYNVYDKGLFAAQPTLSTLYNPKKDVDNEMYGGADEQFDKILKTDRFKPDKRFGGTAEKAGPRDRPVEFEKDAADEADLFGLDKHLTEMKKGKKATEEVGTRGTMRASAGSSMRDGYEGASSRTRIGFERGQ